MKRAAALIVASGTAFGGCLAPSGPRILARDLAPAYTEFAKADPAFVIAYSPLAGVRKTFTASELTRAALRAGVTLDGPAEVCFEWPLEPLSEERIKDALRQAVKDESAEIRISEHANLPAPAGRLEFALPTSGVADSGGAILWRGRIHYGADQEFRVAVRAQVRIRRSRVVAAEPLPARQRIRAGQVRLEEVLVDATEENRAVALEQVIGKTPRTALAAGGSIAVNTLDTPNDIERGDRVKLRSSEAGTTITTEATAEASGHRGDTILVRNVSSGKLLRARIDEEGLVTLSSGGKR